MPATQGLRAYSGVEGSAVSARATTQEQGRLCSWRAWPRSARCWRRALPTAAAARRFRSSARKATPATPRQAVCSRVQGSAVFARVTTQHRRRVGFLRAQGVAELGAALAPGGAYRRNNTPVPLICAQGHACSPQPTNVIQGHGICGECIASFDRVYLLRHPSQRPSRWVLPVAVVVYAAMWGAATRS